MLEKDIIQIRALGKATNYLSGRLLLQVVLIVIAVLCLSIPCYFDSINVSCQAVCYCIFTLPQIWCFADGTALFLFPMPSTTATVQL